jgi:hypothetical protein
MKKISRIFGVILFITLGITVLSIFTTGIEVSAAKAGCYLSGSKVSVGDCKNAAFKAYFKDKGKQDPKKCYVLFATAGGAGVKTEDCKTLTVGKPFTAGSEYKPRDCSKDPFDTDAKKLECVAEEYVKCEKLTGKTKIDACKKSVGGGGGGTSPKAPTSPTTSAAPKAAAKKAPPAGIVKLGTAEELSLPNVDDTTFLGKVIPVVYFIAGSAGVLVILYGGLRYVMSAGSPEKIVAAKNTIIYGSVGLALVFLVPFIIRVTIGFLKGVFG